MIIGKPITTLGGGGLRPVIKVNAPTGSTVTCDGIQGIEVSGTWTFTVELGTHTIVATNSSATQTVTETVVVDEIAQYEVTIEYRTYLYNEGNEYSSLTGGYGGYNYLSSTFYSQGWRAGTIAVTKNTTNITTVVTASGASRISTLFTLNSIDFSQYNTLKIKCNGSINMSGSAWCFIRAALASSVSNRYASINLSYIVSASGSSSFSSTYSIDVSAVSGLYYLAFEIGSQQTTNIVIEQIWLE